MPIQILRADHVLPVSSEPIASGCVAIDGRNIVAVGSFSDVSTEFPDAQIIDHGRAAILPGFVNCHSHLEITAIRGLLEDVEHDFRAWLLKLTSIRANKLSEEEAAAAAVSGVVEGIPPV